RMQLLDEAQFFKKLHALVPGANRTRAAISGGERVISFIADFDHPSVHVARQEFEIHTRNVSTIGEPFVREERKNQGECTRTLEPTVGGSIPCGITLPVTLLKLCTAFGASSLRHCFTSEQAK